jgi:hypothetical protein
MACAAQRLCPAGRYGAVGGLSSPSCSGECEAGFTCPAGSVLPTGGLSSQPRFLDLHPAVALDYGGQPGLGPGDALVSRVLLQGALSAVSSELGLHCHCLPRTASALQRVRNQSIRCCYPCVVAARACPSAPPPGPLFFRCQLVMCSPGPLFFRCHVLPRAPLLPLSCAPPGPSSSVVMCSPGPLFFRCHVQRACPVPLCRCARCPAHAAVASL